MPELNEEIEQSASSVPRLIRLSEYTLEENSASASLETRCFSLGPFSSESKARKARQQLSNWGIDPELDKNEERVREGYWVLLPPASSRDAAQKTIRELKLKGEKDFFLVVSGQQLNSISLGVFAKSESANRRLKQVKDKGFEPIVQTIHLPSEDYWLDWPRSTEVHITDSQLQKIKKRNPEIGQVERACPPNTQ
ncbi:MAG: SPOR domain-containing protein [Gammaproteobacteria bacterium]